MSTVSGSPLASGSVRVNGYSPWVWALRRTMLGVVILAVSIGGAAWLLYEAIDPVAEADIAVGAALRTTTIVDAPLARPPVTGTLPSR